MNGAYLPTHLKASREAESGIAVGDAVIASQEHSFQDRTEVNLHFLICATCVLPYSQVLGIIASATAFDDTRYQPPILTVTVPLLAPTSEDQARSWTAGFWPTIYKRNNPFGPHPSSVSQAEDEIEFEVSRWIGLARHTAEETFKRGKGEPVGALIVHRSPPGSQHAFAVATAGDARLHSISEPSPPAFSNATSHAVLRAIGLVASKRRAIKAGASLDQDLAGQVEVFADKPLTPIEREVYNTESLPANGYLCVGLEIYVTHEPCVMCSMAILHSRFSKVVFAKSMPRTGGLRAGVIDKGVEAQNLRYGLFWRPDLNWKLLAWQWVDEEPEKTSLSSTMVHA